MEKLILLSAACASLFMMQCKKDDDNTAPVNTVVNNEMKAKVYEKDITNTTWTTVGTNSNGYLQLEVAAPQVLTQAALDSNTALVYVYTSDFSPAQWALVPYYTERDITVTAAVSLGKITLRKNQNNAPYTQSWHYKVRLVLVPIGATGSLQKKNYSSLMQNVSDADVKPLQ